MNSLSVKNCLFFFPMAATILLNWNIRFSSVFLSLDTIIFFILAFFVVLSLLLHGKVSKRAVFIIFSFFLGFLLTTIMSPVMSYSAVKSLQLICALFVGVMLADEFYNLSDHYLLYFSVLFCAAILRHSDLFPVNVTIYRVFLLLLQVSLFPFFEKENFFKIVIMVPVIGLILLENSKGLILASLVPMIIVIMKNRINFKIVSGLCVMASVMVILSLINTEVVFGRISDIFNPFSSTSSLPRITLAYSGIVAFLDNPIFGVGIGGMNHPDVFMEYYQSNIIYYYAESDEIIQHDQVFMDRTSGVHNMYIDILASGGIILAGIFTVYVWESFKNTKEYNTKKLFMIAFLIYAMSWHFFSSAIGAFIVGTFYSSRGPNLREE